jgi:multiple sugar transport system substrate-binding protein
LPDVCTFWVRDSDQAIVDPLVKAYNAHSATNIKLSVIPAMQFVTKFATSIAGGTPPDVVAIDLIYLPAFSKAGQMTDLTAQAKALSFFDKLSPSHIRLSTHEGKLYAVPFSAEASVLVYNKDLFKKIPDLEFPRHPDRLVFPQAPVPDFRRCGSCAPGLRGPLDWRR